MRIIDNSTEYTRTITRENGMRLDICAFRDRKELVVALVIDNDIYVEAVVFSSEELKVLKEHLSDPVTLQILASPLQGA